MREDVTRRSGMTGAPWAVLSGRAALTLMTLTLTGCHVENKQAPQADPQQQLAQRPSLEATQAQLQGAFDQIATAVDALVPGIAWEDGGNETSMGCFEPYDETAGRIYFMPNRIAPGIPLTSEQWASIETAARAAAAGIGATTVQVMADSPTHHDISFSSPDGIEMEVGWQGSVLIAGSTGCRLPENAAKQ